MDVKTIKTPEKRDLHLSLWLTTTEMKSVKDYCERATTGDGHKKLTVSQLFRQAVNDFTGEQIF